MKTTQSRLNLSHLTNSLASLVLLGIALAGANPSARGGTLGDALDAPDLTWTTGGDAMWFSQTTNTHDGVEAAQSGTMTGYYDESWLETTVTGRVAVLFWWKGSSDPNYYSIYLQTNSGWVGGLVGERDWEQQAVMFDSGTNTLLWTHFVPGTDPTNWQANAAWLDQVLVTNIAGLAPVFLAQAPPTFAAPEYAPFGTNLTALVIGDIPMSYQWQRYGTNLTEGWPFYQVTSPSLYLYPRTEDETGGEYRLVASNTWGMTTSAVCVVSIVPSQPILLSYDPADAVIALGAYYSLYVSAYGSPPFAYQWFTNGTPVPSATNDYYPLWPASLADSGAYSVVVTNLYGAATSRVAQVSISTALPSIVSGPDPEVAELSPGDYAYFGVQASGPEPLSYSWRRVGDAAELGYWNYLYFSVDPTNSGLYRVIVTNNNGAVTSRVSVLAVAPVTALGVALDAPSLSITNYHPWWPMWSPDVTGTNAHDGLCAARSPAIGDWDSATFGTSVTGPMNISFWWRISAGAEAFLEVSVDDSLNNSISGETDWQQQTLDVPAGDHTLTWTYRKNAAGIAGQDAAWVDQLVVGNSGPSGGEITNFTSGGDAPWFTQSSNTHDGVEAWQSGPLTDDQQSWLETTVIGPGALTFWWMVESEACCDALRFSVDGVEQTNIAGLVSWQQESVALAAGSHTLRWLYSKDGSVSVPRDAGWVDEVTFTPSAGEITNFTTGGAADWFVQTTNTHDGVKAWQSGAIGDFGLTWLGATVTGPGTLTFWWAVDSEEGSDFLWFGTVADGMLASISGQGAGWQQQSFTLGPGTHELQWVYWKNGSAYAGADAGWVDEVTFTPSPPPPTFTLEQALDVTNLTFTTGGDVPWWIETTNTHAGVMALQSGAIGDNQQSWLRTTVSGPGTLTFWYALSTEAYHDNFFIPFFGDFAYTSGGAYYFWYQETLNIPDGTYTLEWRYQKDASGSGGSDAVWMDEVVWTPAETPHVTVGPQWKYPGETCAFTASITGMGPFTFQWYRDDAPIPGATAADLSPFTATYANAGLYSLVASNYAGFGTNSAKLVVAPIFYQLTDLGSLWTGDFTTYANGVNNHGDVVGNCSTNASGLGHAWVWSGGVLTDLGDALGGGDSQAYAINDQGDIVGTARVPGTTNYNAIRWRKVGASYAMDDLGRNGWPYAFAQAINNAGDIVFSMTDGGKSGSGNRRAFLWRQGDLLPLGNLIPVWPDDIGDAFGWAINSLGFIAGSANAAPPAPGENTLKRGWLYNGSWRLNVHDAYSIASLPGVTGTIDSSGAYAVNDYGDVAGHYMRAEFGATGCFIASGTNAFKVTGWGTYVQGLNNHGDLLAIVDVLSLYCSTNAAAPARFSDGRPDYSDHALFPLQDLVPGGLGTFASIGASFWTYNALNEARGIVGDGVTMSGASHAFLAQPIARPGNVPPVQASPLIVTNYGNTLVIPIAQLLATCTDANGDTLALVAAEGRSADLATVRRSGNFLLYTPPASSYSDPDSIHGTILDYHGGQTPVTIIVRNRPSPPVPGIRQLVLVRDLGPQPFVRFRAPPGQIWRLEASDTLAAGSWTTLVTFLVGPDWMVDFTDAAGLMRPQRFYRAVSP